MGTDIGTTPGITLYRVILPKKTCTHDCTHILICAPPDSFEHCILHSVMVREFLSFAGSALFFSAILQKHIFLDVLSPNDTLNNIIYQGAGWEFTREVDNLFFFPIGIFAVRNKKGA